MMNKILVVDDDLDILSLVQMILRMNNFIVETIFRWEEIDSKILAFKPDLILLDVMLGGADGRDICRNLHSDKKNRDLPVVLFSANPEMRKCTKGCDAKAFIAKPFEVSTLLRTIQESVN
jgi:DNA-binding response OmpR family regulator